MAHVESTVCLPGFVSQREEGVKMAQPVRWLNDWLPSGTRLLSKACSPQPQRRCKTDLFNPKALWMIWFMTMVLHTVHTNIHTHKWIHYRADEAVESGGKAGRVEVNVQNIVHIFLMNRTAAITNINCNIASHGFHSSAQINMSKLILQFLPWYVNNTTTLVFKLQTDELVFDLQHLFSCIMIDMLQCSSSHS